MTTTIIITTFGTNPTSTAPLLVQASPLQLAVPPLPPETPSPSSQPQPQLPLVPSAPPQPVQAAITSSDANGIFMPTTSINATYNTITITNAITNTRSTSGAS
ncbi:hypothetical protein PoB_000267300 [Plakobranchus ocellatus]|uniref:Uncharacterized protein n=1 Tax=Plakobranchus ocellatus TaxID=259542 RepID=A0AAV3Y1D4_9GAST|nr:hypothetical protein PoB_000267300 [Plakobranchus ocellatus]